MAETLIETVLGIDVSPQRVWATIGDTSRYAEWVVNTEAVVKASAPVARAGVTYEERNTVIGPFTGTTRWHVTAFEPGRRAVHDGEGLTIVRWMRLELIVEPDAGGTRYTQRFSYVPALGPLGPVVNLMLRPSVSRDMHRSAQALKDLCEREARTAG